MKTQFDFEKREFEMMVYAIDAYQFYLLCLRLQTIHIK